MEPQIYVNLPVKNLNQSIAFFTQLGFKFNPQFTDENATCMIIGEDSFVMLLIEGFFQTFTNKSIADAKSTTEVLLCISVQSRPEVDSMVKKAIAAGGKSHQKPQDHGFMYMHGFEDLDGHLWEIMFVEPQAQTS
ncbi:MAG: VOC family protein [Methylophilaceae bacterium]